MHFSTAEKVLELRRGGVGDMWDKRALTNGGMVVQGSKEGMMGYFPSCDCRRP